MLTRWTAGGHELDECCSKLHGLALLTLILLRHRTPAVPPIPLPLPSSVINLSLLLCLQVFVPPLKSLRFLPSLLTLYICCHNKSMLYYKVKPQSCSSKGFQLAVSLHFITYADYSPGSMQCSRENWCPAQEEYGTQAVFRQKKWVQVTVAQEVERVNHLSEGHWVSPGSFCHHAEVSLGKILNPKLSLKAESVCEWCVNGWMWLVV